jgi:hypothetical protein
MSGRVEVLGELDVGAIFPTMAALFAAMQADVAGNLDGALSVAGELSVELPSLSAGVQAAAEVLAELQASTGGIGFSADVEADLIANLRLEASLLAGFIVALGMTGAKAEVFKYSGDAASFGAACNGEVGSGIQGGLPSDQCQALVFVTRYPAFMEALFRLVLA